MPSFKTILNTIIIVIGAIASLIAIIQFSITIAAIIVVITVVILILNFITSRRRKPGLVPVSISHNVALFTALEQVNSSFNANIELSVFQKNVTYSEGGKTSNVTYIFEGKNNSKSESVDGIDIALSGGSSQKLRKLNINAICFDSSGDQHRIRPVKKNLTPFSKHICIPFIGPLSPGAPFKMQLDYVWKKAIVSDEDSTSYFPLKLFPKGVKRMKTRLEFMQKPSIIGVYEVDVRRKKAFPLCSLATASTMSPFVYEWTINEPKKVYIIWRRVKLQ